MADNNTTTTPAAPASATPGGAPAASATTPASTTAAPAITGFDDNDWEDTPSAPAANPEKEEEGTPGTTPENIAASTTKPKEDEEIVDANVYLKKELGYDDWGAAKKEIEELRQLKINAPKAHKFDEFVKEKEDDVYNYLRAKKELANVQTLDASKVEDAAKLIKLNLQYKHKDLTADEITYLYNREYALPKKPVQKEDQDDDEYRDAVADWEERVREKQMSISIAAKMAKPELAQVATTLAIPEINISAPAPQQPTPQEVEAAKAQQEAYFQAVGKGVKDFTGFNVEYKEGDTSVPIKYEVSNEDRAKVEPILKSMATDFSYFEKRWMNADGSINTSKMASDIFLVENQGMIFQKLVNEAATQKQLLDQKQRSNIQLDSPDGGSAPNRQPANVNFGDEVWSM